MSQRERMQGDEQTMVTFILRAQRNGELSVAGDFNGRDPAQLPLTKRGKK